MLPGMSAAAALVRRGDLRQAMSVIKDALHGRSGPIDVTPPDAARTFEHEAAATAEGRFESHIHSSPAGTREYKLYVPPGYRGEPMPLVVMLHGCTQSADDFAAGTRMNELAAEHGFLVAYPEQARNANPNKCWNWFKRGDQQRERGEPSIIASIVSAVKSSHAVDERRIYVAGLSSGGAMAATLAATYPDVFAAVGVHSGLPYGCAHDLPSGLAAMRSGGHGETAPPMRAIVFHGDADPVVHPRNGEAVFAQWNDSAADDASVETSPGANGHGYTRHTVRDAAGRPRLEHWIVHGAGHAWSGGSPAGTHSDPRGPDASREMVRFFLLP
jgi:poly(hydroxyalkanoate) depolymerase family esterase